VSTVIEKLARSPQESGLFLDFDGTLAPIVPRPEHARPLPGVPEILGELSSWFRVVAVVSGRSAAQLAEWLGPDIEIWGLHGAQRALGGRVEITSELKRFERPMAAVLREAEERMNQIGIDGTLVEAKHIMVGIHWRMAGDGELAERRMTELARDLAARYGLAIGRGKMALELRPPVEVSKRGIVLRRVREEELRGVAFAGDDVVDLPAFDAMDELAREGLATAKIAVSSTEAPADLLERADEVVQEPEGMLEWLQELRAESGGVVGGSPD
jgi:trehalose 6-phosphate phosphatase